MAVKRNAQSAWAEDSRPREKRSARARIQADLEQRGVSAEFCSALSSRLESQVTSFDSTSYANLLDGVAAAYGVHAETTEALASRLRELSEIERLMSAFSGELSKLDEVLSVLSAHVGRMRTSTPSQRILH